jgi:hypothetical protein
LPPRWLTDLAWWPLRQEWCWSRPRWLPWLGAAAGAAACGEALLVVVVVVVLWLDCIELGCEVFDALPAASGEAGVLDEALGDALDAVEFELFMPLMPLFEAAPGLLEAPLFEQLEAIMFTLLT